MCSQLRRICNMSGTKTGKDSRHHAHSNSSIRNLKQASTRPEVGFVSSRSSILSGSRNARKFCNVLASFGSFWNESSQTVLSVWLYSTGTSPRVCIFAACNRYIGRNSSYEQPRSRIKSLIWTIARGRQPRRWHKVFAAAESSSLTGVAPVKAHKTSSPTSALKDSRCTMFVARFEAIEGDRVVIRMEPLSLAGQTCKGMSIFSTLSNMRRNRRPEVFSQSLTFKLAWYSSSVSSSPFGKPNFFAKVERA